ncbi:hypothetical protein BKA82DRAFT_4186494 [Pisolithus tinctorius]|nr:hypothetical protein BKA82DRAFT_4186494 [Pisolithus tinctorius]
MSVVSHSHRLKLDGWWVWLDKHAGQKIVLGDYGDYSDGNFKCDGNIFEDMRALGIDSMDPVYHPVVSRVSGDQFYWHEFRDQNDHDLPYDDDRKELELNRLKGYSLPANQHFVLLLKAYCTRLAGKYLVITIIQHSDVPLRIGCRAKRRDSGGELAPNNVNHFADLTPFYTVASPQVWRRDPACTQRRELFKTVRERFYALVNMIPPLTILVVCLVDMISSVNLHELKLVTSLPCVGQPYEIHSSSLTMATE